jgi:DNA-directed RNA polymerase specialized sigma24 family protein
MTEKQILERFVAENDPEALRAIVERHGSLVLSVCRGVLREPADVEDAFQKTFVLLARHAATIEGRESLAPWLHRAALRVAKEVQANAVDRPLPPTPGSADDDTFAGDPETVETATPPAERFPSARKHDHDVAAARLVSSVALVKARIARARRRLQVRFQTVIRCDPFAGSRDSRSKLGRLTTSDRCRDARGRLFYYPPYPPGTG